MSIINDSKVLGSGTQNIVLETAGHIYIKVNDRYYELNFRDPNNKQKTVVNNTTITNNTSEPVDLSDYVTEDYLKSALTEYVTKRTWNDIKQTQTMLADAQLEGFTEAINPITIQTMQMIVGSEQLQFEFIENLVKNIETEDDPPQIVATTEIPRIVGHAVRVEGDILICPPGYIIHHTLRTNVVSPAKNVKDYWRWDVKNSSDAFGDANRTDTRIDLSDDDKAYYLYIVVDKREDPDQTTLDAQDAYTESDSDKAGRYAKVDRGTFMLSETGIPIEPEDDPNHFYLLYAIINSKDSDGERSIGYLNGFTEILPGQITAYIFKSADGTQFLDFLNKTFRVGDNNQYIYWDGTNLQIRGSLEVIGGNLQDVLNNLQDQINGDVNLWFSDDSNNDNDQLSPAQDKHCVPTLNTWPANQWTQQLDPVTGNETRPSTESQHIGDIYYVVDDLSGYDPTDPTSVTYKGTCYRFLKQSRTVGGVTQYYYEWVEINDSALAQALAAAAEARALAQEAINKLNGWASDGVISPSEITGIREEFEFVKSDFANLTKDSQLYGLYKTPSDDGYAASLYGLYETAKNTYYNWLDKIIYEYDHPTTPCVVDGCVVLSEVKTKYSYSTDFVNTFSSYYTTRTNLYQAIAAAIDNKFTNLENEIAGYEYLKLALKGKTVVNGGLILSSLIELGDWTDSNNDGIVDSITVHSGINGQYTKTDGHGNLTHHDIGAWFGGEMADKEDYYQWNSNTLSWGDPISTYDPTNPNVDIADTVFRHDGSGYLANGAIVWNSDGEIRLPGILLKNGQISIDPSISILGGGGETLGTYNAFFEEVETPAGSGNYAVRLKPAYIGLYADGWITAGGVGSGGSGGGTGNITISNVTDYSIDVTFGGFGTHTLSKLPIFNGITAPNPGVSNIGYTVVWNGSQWSYGKAGVDVVTSITDQSPNNQPPSALAVYNFVNSGYALGTNGIANSAARLSDNNAYTAWGQTFFSSGVPTSISDAPLSGVTNINNILSFPNNTVSISSNVSLATGVTTQGGNEYNKVYLGNSVSYTTLNQSGSYLTWDNTAHAWHLVGNLYADGWITAGGQNSSGGGQSGGEYNTIEIIKLNNSELPITDKTVNINAVTSIMVNGQEKTLSDPLYPGRIDLGTISVDLSGYLPLTAGSTKKLTDTLYSTVETGTAPFNIKSETLVSYLNADKLDNYHLYQLININGFNESNAWTGSPNGYLITQLNATNPSSSEKPYSIIGGNHCTVIQVSPGETNYSSQLAFGITSPTLAWRNKNGSATWSAWQKINAGKADTLSTSRTIWGQPFDGSSNITGNMAGVGTISFTAQNSATSGVHLEVVTINGQRYLHTSLPFYSDSAITAGGIGSSSIDPGGMGTVTGIKINNGDVIDPDENGIINILSDNITAVQIQSDWNQTNTNAKDYIKNKPSAGNIGVPVYFDLNKVIHPIDYLNIDPEPSNSVILPYFFNDLAFLHKRAGGNITATVDGSSYTFSDYEKEAMFDGTTGFAAITVSSQNSVIELNISAPTDTTWQYGQKFYIDFGTMSWVAKSITLKVYTGSTLHGTFSTDEDLTVCHWEKAIPSLGSNTSPLSLKITLTSFVNSGDAQTPRYITRLCQIGLISFNSKAASMTFMSRGKNDDVWRNINPSGTYNLGESGKRWDTVYANTINATNVSFNGLSLDNFVKTTNEDQNIDGNKTFLGSLRYKAHIDYLGASTNTKIRLNSIDAIYLNKNSNNVIDDITLYSTTTYFNGTVRRRNSLPSGVVANLGVSGNPWNHLYISEGITLNEKPLVTYNSSIWTSDNQTHISAIIGSGFLGQYHNLQLKGADIYLYSEQNTWAINVNSSLIQTNKPLVPYNTGNSTLGTSAKPWGIFYGNRWYPNYNSASGLYLEYNASIGKFYISGDLVASGAIIAGHTASGSLNYTWQVGSTMTPVSTSINIGAYNNKFNTLYVNRIGASDYPTTIIYSNSIEVYDLEATNFTTTNLGTSQDYISNLYLSSDGFHYTGYIIELYNVTSAASNKTNADIGFNEETGNNDLEKILSGQITHIKTTSGSITMMLSIAKVQKTSNNIYTIWYGSNYKLTSTGSSGSSRRWTVAVSW